MINNRKIKRIARAIMAWGILSLAAAGVVADESPYAKSPTAAVSYSYSQWLADAARREALGYAYSGVETFGSFAVTRDESLIGGLGEEWRRVLWDTADIRQEMRAFVLAALNGEQYDWRLAGENKVLGLTNSLPDITTDVLSDLAEAWAQSSGTVEHINVEWRSGLGERRAHIALDIVGGLRETADEALAWQLRGYVTQDRNKGLNSGLIWRHAAADNTRLWGVNTFVDYEHTSSTDFWRWSFGLEGQWQAFDFSANQYVPISDPKVLGVYEYYSARGRDIQTYVRLAELLGDALFLDIAAGLTYYYWEGKGRGQGTEEGLIYGLRFGSYLNTPSPGKPLVLEVEVDDRQDVGARLSYVYYFNDGDNSASAASGLYTYNALPYDARTHFYAPVRREYTQRIRRWLRQPLVYDILTRDSAGLRRTVLAVNVYAGVLTTPPITAAIISVRSLSGDDLVPGNPSDIITAYSISLTSTNPAGVSLLANHLTLQNNGMLLLTQQIAALGGGRIVTAQMQLLGVSPSGFAFNLSWQIVLRDRTVLSPPRLTPGGGSAEIGVAGNIYSARVPTTSDAVLLARVGVSGATPPYIVSLVGGNTPALQGISIVAATARLLDATPPHQVRIHGGYAEVVWSAAPNSNPFIFTLRTMSGGEQQDVVINVSPVPFVPAFSAVPGAGISPIEAGSAQTLAVALSVPRYSGNPPYDYTLMSERASLFSIAPSAVGVRNARLANVAASSSSSAAPSNVALQISGGGSVRLLVNIPLDVAPLNVIHITIAVSDAGGRQGSAILSTDIVLPPFAADAPAARSLDYYYSTVAASFAEQNLYTLALSGSSGYYARPLAALPGRLRFDESSSGVYVLRLLAGGTVELTTIMTIAYGDAYGRRGDIILTASVAPDLFAVRVFQSLAVISRAVVGTSQVIATLGVQNPRKVGLLRYELWAANGSELATDLAAQVKLADNTVFWTSGLGNGDATITVGVRVVGTGTVSALSPLRFEVTDPPLVMNVVGGATSITVNPVAGAILTVDIQSATDGGTPSTLSLTAFDGSALPPSIDALFNVNNSILLLAGNSPFITTLRLQGFDAQGRRSTVVLLTVQALSLGLNADATRRIQHFYADTASNYTAGDLYTISLTGSSLDRYARIIGSLPTWLQFGATEGTSVYVLSLQAATATPRTAIISLTYGDVTGERGLLTLTVEALVDAYLVLISQALNVVSRGVETNQVIASLGVQDPRNFGVASYELLAKDGGALATDLAAQVKLVDSTTISWVSGGGSGATVITVGVQATGADSASTKSPVAQLIFNVIDPSLEIELGASSVSVTYTFAAQSILTVSVGSNTDSGAARELSMFAEDGNALPVAVAAVLSVNGTVLNVVGVTADVNPIVTLITMQAVGFDAQGRRSDGLLFTLDLATRFALEMDTSTVRLPGLVRRNVLTITMHGSNSQIEIERMPSQLSLVTSALSANETKLRMEAVLTVRTSYAANAAAADIEIIVHGSDSTSRPRTSQTLTLRVTPFGLMLAGGQGPAHNQQAATDFHKDVWRFDTTDRYWEEVGTLPTALRNAAVLFYQNTIYLFGGNTGTNTSATRVPASNKVLYSNDGGMTWQESSAAVNMPALPNNSANAVPIIVNGTLFLVGGRTTEGSPNDPSAQSTRDKDFIKAFALSGLGNSASTWAVTESARHPFRSANNPLGYLQAAFQHFAGYHNGVMFMYGGRNNDSSSGETFGAGNLSRFSATSTPTTSASWRFRDNIRIDGGIRDGNFKQDFIGGQVAVFGGQAFSIGNRSNARPAQLYLRIKADTLSALVAAAQPAFSSLPNMQLNVFSSNATPTGLPPTAAVGTRYISNGYRLFSLAKDHLPHLYIAGFGEGSGGMRVYRCQTATACVAASGNSTWDERAIDTTISSNAPSRRSNFMLVGANNISWNDN